MAKYLQFTSVQNTKLAEKFLNDQTNQKLSKIIKGNKKNLAVKLHTCEVDNLYLVIVRGKFDRILIKLGKECGFPRGFPILWCPGKYTRYFGFLPKFSNDDRQTVDDVSVGNTQSVRFFKKWSGFLGQLLVWDHEGQNYWTACSKNAADHELMFVQDAKRLFEPFITPTLVANMIAKKLHLCAEMISLQDEVHGARVLKETPIVTVVGTSSLDDNRFVDFLHHTEVVDFCQENSLPCDSAITITGKKSCDLFFQALTRDRDFMTNSKFKHTLDDIPARDISVQKGTITHAEVQGDTLEGLVMHMTRHDGTTETKKYKFPNYTIRTMLLRTVFNCSTFDNDSRVNYDFVLSNSLRKRAQRYASYWCVSEKGKSYWYERALTGFMLFNHIISGTESGNQFKKSLGLTDENMIGVHIRLADYMLNAVPPFEVSSKFDELSRKVDATVIVILGPIGSGKSRIGNLLVGVHGGDQNYIHIDGDDLGLGSKATLGLGMERNVYTQWKIISALYQGKIPVISTGGGALTSFNSVVIRGVVRDVLNLSLNLIVLVPDPTITQLTEFQPAINPNTLTFYNNTKSVEKVVKRRLQKGEWELDTKYKTKKNGVDEFCQFIGNISKKNSKFCTKFMEESDYTFLFPAVTPNNYKKVASLDFDTVHGVVTNNNAKPTVGKFQQIRILCHVTKPQMKIDKYHHITLEFDGDRNIEKTWLDFETMNNKIKTFDMGGSLVCLKNGNNKVTIAIPTNKVHSDNSTHITINPGPHAPKEMRQIALAIQAGASTIELPIKNKETTVTYDIPARFESCNIKMMTTFGI